VTDWLSASAFHHEPHGPAVPAFACRQCLETIALMDVLGFKSVVILRSSTRGVNYRVA
jgi:hypothetical protein